MALSLAVPRPVHFLQKKEARSVMLRSAHGTAAVGPAPTAGSAFAAPASMSLETGATSTPGAAYASQQLLWLQLQMLALSATSSSGSPASMGLAPARVALGDTSTTGAAAAPPPSSAAGGAAAVPHPPHLMLQMQQYMQMLQQRHFAAAAAPAASSDGGARAAAAAVDGAPQELSGAAALLTKELKKIAPLARRNWIGERLHPQVQKALEADHAGTSRLAGKITGMLLESLDESELTDVCSDARMLNEYVQDALRVLREADAKSSDPKLAHLPAAAPAAAGSEMSAVLGATVSTVAPLFKSAAVVARPASSGLAALPSAFGAAAASEVMPAAPTAAGGAASGGSAPTDAATAAFLSQLARASPDQRMIMIGERLYGLVAARRSGHTGKLTDLLMQDKDSWELLRLLQSPPELDACIREVEAKLAGSAAIALSPPTSRALAAATELPCASAAAASKSTAAAQLAALARAAESTNEDQELRERLHALIVAREPHDAVAITAALLKEVAKSELALLLKRPYELELRIKAIVKVLAKPARPAAAAVGTEGAGKLTASSVAAPLSGVPGSGSAAALTSDAAAPVAYHSGGMPVYRSGLRLRGLPPDEELLSEFVQGSLGGAPVSVWIWSDEAATSSINKLLDKAAARFERGVPGTLRLLGAYNGPPEGAAAVRPLLALLFEPAERTLEAITPSTSSAAGDTSVGSIPMDARLTMLERVAATLQRLHHIGLQHGRLHPGLVALDPHDSPRLAVVPPSWLSTQKRRPRLPRQYNADACRGAKPSASPAADDVYSFAMLMWHVICGELPADADADTRPIAGALRAAGADEAAIGAFVALCSRLCRDRPEMKVAADELREAVIAFRSSASAVAARGDTSAGAKLPVRAVAPAGSTSSSSSSSTTTAVTAAPVGITSHRASHGGSGAAAGGAGAATASVTVRVQGPLSELDEAVDAAEAANPDALRMTVAAQEAGAILGEPPMDPEAANRLLAAAHAGYGSKARLAAIARFVEVNPDAASSASELHISVLKTTSDDLDAFGDALCGMPRLQRLIIPGCEGPCNAGMLLALEIAYALPSLPLLRHLNLDHCQLRDAGATMLTSKLPCLPLLEVLRLQQNLISDDHVAAIAAVLIHLPSLRELYLGSNWSHFSSVEQRTVFPRAGNGAARALARALPFLPKLRLLDLSGGHSIAGEAAAELKAAAAATGITLSL